MASSYSDLQANQSDAPGGFSASAGRAQFGQASTSAISMRWSALLDAAAIVASLAAIPAEPQNAEVRAFPATLRNLGQDRSALAEQGVEDLHTIMERGLSALLAVHARGVSPVPAARALWHEFIAARDALLALSRTSNRRGPIRAA